MKTKVFVCLFAAIFCIGVSNTFDMFQPVVDGSLALEQVKNPSTATSTLMRNSNSIDFKPYIFTGFVIFTLIVFAKETKLLLTSIKDSM